MTLVPERHDLSLDRRLDPPPRPNFTPFALARASPAFTRSRMMPRSNSANTPSIWNIALPAVVVVSSPCW
jgi:hypothetical protein